MKKNDLPFNAVASCLQRIVAFVCGVLLSAAVMSTAHAQALPHNVLLIIADDVGVDMIGAYQPLVSSTNVPSTPAINSLAASGVLFRNTWVNPICAATRSSIQTGRYGFRTGATGALWDMSHNEYSIGKILHRDPNNTFASALFGKWGLWFQYGTSVGEVNPVQMGYDHFSGSLGASITLSQYFNYNSIDPIIPANRGVTSFNFSNCNQHDANSFQDPNCVLTEPLPISPNYATTQNADDAIAWIDTPRGNRPWFVTLAFNAAHRAIHNPPYATPLGLPQGFDCNLNLDNTRLCYRAMIEAMDMEIQRVLAHVNLAQTTVIFIGDNGTVEQMSLPPFASDRTKFTLYEGGVKVPLIIAGADVVTNRHSQLSDALVNGSDLFMTVLDIAQVDHNYFPANFPIDANNPRYTGQVWQHDSRSILPILQDPCTGGICRVQTRRFAYAETDDGGGSNGTTATVGKTIRDTSGYKLLALGTGWEFYNLATDPAEQLNLVNSATGLLNAVSPDPKSVLALAKLRKILGERGAAPNILAANSRSGDINDDGVVDIADLMLLQQYLIHAATPTATELVHGDLYPTATGDGKLTVSDLLLLAKMVLNH